MKLKVLQVEDDLDWQEIFAEEAGNLGLELNQFSSREEALAAIKKEKPDIVITDLHLGENDRSGYRIAEAAIKAGVENVTIASNTETPSQIIEGVVIQDKSSALKWLKSVAKGSTERR